MGKWQRQVKPEIRDFQCMGSPGRGNIRAFHPEKPDDFHVEVSMSIGEAGGRDSEYFSVSVITPKNLASLVAENGPQFGGHHLVVASWDAQAAMDLLRGAIETIQAASWSDVRDRLRRILYYGE